ncbi:hypothetical protein Bca52824_017687 [Brassica carinata]|uniref:Uncharacterized protein n=1 Tax=Brassica carinata TaxID=52824 RepID=A0A8X7VPJ0_BRACI|nr:hypothetical protein Bca52824_017687 [Brassica carinata]
MGKIPKAYPSYSEILRAQLGDGSFGSISTPKGAKAKASPSEVATTGLEDIEVQRSPGGMTDATTTDFSAKESIEPTSDVDPSRKKKKKKKKSSRKSAVDPGNVDDLAEEDREASDHLIDGVDGPGSSAEKDRAGSFVAKRKEPTDGGSRDLGEKKLKRSHDIRLSSSEGIVLPASRLLPWGGSDPPSDRLALAAHRRDLVSQRSCISAAATERLDKFRDYMIDRDRREEKLVLHSAAFGTLESMDVLKDLGIPIPQVLIDTLAANEAKYRKEMEEIAVEVISEQDLVLPRFPGLEAAQKLNQPDSSLGDADPIAAAALRSSGPASGNPATQVTLTGSPELMVTDPDVGGASGATSLDRVDED